MVSSASSWKLMAALVRPTSYRWAISSRVFLAGAAGSEALGRSGRRARRERGPADQPCVGLAAGAGLRPDHGEWFDHRGGGVGFVTSLRLPSDGLGGVSAPANTEAGFPVTATPCRMPVRSAPARIVLLRIVGLGKAGRQSPAGRPRVLLPAGRGFGLWIPPGACRPWTVIATLSLPG